jgi:hypothetical protein
VHSPGPVGAVGLFREAIVLQDIADLPAGADDLESDAARDKLAMEVVQHFRARGKGDDDRPQMTILISGAALTFAITVSSTVSASM